MYPGFIFTFLLSFLAFYIIQPKLENVELNQILEINNKKIIIEDESTYVLLNSFNKNKIKFNKEYYLSNIILDNSYNNMSEKEINYYFKDFLNNEIKNCKKIDKSKIDKSYKSNSYFNSLKTIFILEDLKHSTLFIKESPKKVSLFLNNKKIKIKIDYYNKNIYYECDNESNFKFLYQINKNINELLNE